MFEVKKIGHHLGSEILGLDLSQPIGEETFQKFSRAFFENEVVVIKNQKITPEQHINFTKRFGVLEAHVRKESRHEGYDEIFVLSNVEGPDGRPIGAIDAGRFWHSDLSYKEHPSMLSALYSVEIPVCEDGQVLGDTNYASTTAAYLALPETMKKRLEGLQSVHSYAFYRNKNRHAQKEEAAKGGRVIEEKELTEEQLKTVPDVTSPIVRVHPVTGKKCLFVNEAHTSHIVGIPEYESKDILNELYNHIVQEEFRFKHTWGVGDLLIWDNCATQHKATFDYRLPLRRLMFRTTVRGSIPF